jgi:fucose permease
VTSTRATAPAGALVTAAAGMAVCLGFGRFSVGLLLPEMKRDLALSYVAAGVLASANLTAYLAGVLALPRLGRRVPFARLLQAALLLATAGLALAAVPAPVWLAVAALGLTGVAGALAWISSASLGATMGRRSGAGATSG